MRRLRARIEAFPVAGSFTISRGSRTEAIVVVAEVVEDDHVGRGECTPYPRYGETPEGVAAEIETMAEAIGNGLSRQELLQIMPAGAARNAIDCALWDLEAKCTGKPVFELAGLPAPQPLVTAVTVSLGTPETMAIAAARYADRPLIKVKLGGEGDPDRIRAVRNAAPKAKIIVDANEAWHAETLDGNLRACAEAQIAMIEQPLPAAEDGALGTYDLPVPLCADESFHDAASLDALSPAYSMVNIKLDKTGGLTGAILAMQEAQKRGLEIMSGCMLCTSLAIAPAALLAQSARFVDLDGALLLARDRMPGLSARGSILSPYLSGLWG